MIGVGAPLAHLLDVRQALGAGHAEIDQRQVQRLVHPLHQLAHVDRGHELDTRLQLRQLVRHRIDDEPVIVCNQDFHGMYGRARTLGGVPADVKPEPRRRQSAAARPNGQTRGLGL
jgi:hypothetical protein